MMNKDLVTLIEKLNDGVPAKVDRWPGNDGEDIIYNHSEATAIMKEAASVLVEILNVLERISAHTNPDDPESYRCDDREGCLDTVHAISKAALAKTIG